MSWAMCTFATLSSPRFFISRLIFTRVGSQRWHFHCTPYLLVPLSRSTGDHPRLIDAVWWGRDRLLRLHDRLHIYPAWELFTSPGIIIISGPSKRGGRITKSVVCREVTQQLDSWSADVVSVWAGGVRWKGDVKRDISLSCLFWRLSASSSRRFVQIRRLPGVSYGVKVDGPQPCPPRYLCRFDFFHVTFSSVFVSFSLATTRIKIRFYKARYPVINAIYFTVDRSVSQNPSRLFWEEFSHVRVTAQKLLALKHPPLVMQLNLTRALDCTIPGMSLNAWFCWNATVANHHLRFISYIKKSGIHPRVILKFDLLL